MRVTFEDGTHLRADFILSATQRFELVPIPSTLELVIRNDSRAAAKLGVGTKLLAGSSLDAYTVVKVRRAQSAQPQHDGEPVEVLEFTALLSQFLALAQPLPRSVVKVGASLGDCYRACGATCRVGDDIPAWRFSCFAGDFPTLQIARLMQEEGAVPVWSARKTLDFRRYDDMLTGEPLTTVSEGAAQAVDSPLIEQHEIPTAYTCDKAGAFVLGRRDVARGAVFVPRATKRIAENMSRCIVVRRTLAGALAGNLRPGDMVQVGTSRQIVVAAAHKTENGAGGDPSQITKLWLGEVQR